MVCPNGVAQEKANVRKYEKEMKYEKAAASCRRLSTAFSEENDMYKQMYGEGVEALRKKAQHWRWKAKTYDELAS